jgi:hypothetical protein
VRTLNKTLLDNLRSSRKRGAVALYVVMHALWQKDRGRKPSESYNDILNPRKALAKAREDLLHYKPMVGEHVKAAIAHMCKIARLTHETVRGEFNEIPIVAHPNSSRAALLLQFWNDVARRREEYEKSPEYARRQQEEKEQRETARIKVAGLMKLLPNLDFNNVEELLDWLSALEEARDGGIVGVDQDRIIKIFTAHGYKVDANCENEFDEEDSDNHARYIIGQAIKSGYPPLTGHFTREWKKKFRGSDFTVLVLGVY